MKEFSKEEISIIMEYTDEMLGIFNSILQDEFQTDEDAYIVCGTKRFYKKDFESLRMKLQTGNGS